MQAIANRSAALDLLGRANARTRKAIDRAWKEADRQAHDCVTTIHVLLALLHTGGKVARVLAIHGLDSESVRAENDRIEQQSRERILEVAPPSESLGIEAHRPGGSQGSGIPATPTVGRALRHAIEAAAREGVRQVGTEHLLLGLINDEESCVTGFLTAMDLDLQRIRDAVTKQ